MALSARALVSNSRPLLQNNLRFLSSSLPRPVRLCAPYRSFHRTSSLCDDKKPSRGRQSAPPQAKGSKPDIRQSKRSDGARKSAKPVENPVDEDHIVVKEEHADGSIELTNGMILSQSEFRELMNEDNDEVHIKVTRKNPDGSVELSNGDVIPRAIFEEFVKLDTNMNETLSDEEKHDLQTRFLLKVSESGSLDAGLRLMGETNISPKERQQIVKYLDTFKGLDNRLQGLEELEASVSRAAEDPAAMDEILSSLSKSKKDLLNTKLSEQEKKLFRKLGADVDDPEDLERVAWEELEKIHGKSRQDIKNEQIRERLEDDLDLLPPGQKEEYLKALASGKGIKKTGKLTAEEKEERDLMKRAIEIAQNKKYEQDIEQKYFGRVEGDRGMKDEKEREKPGFWNYEDDEDLGEDEEWNNDDIPTKGHRELELQRDIREYARMMVWELPLLSKLAKPFSPPTAQDVLTFRYTTYLGDEHPSEKKVTVEFSPSALPNLTEVQRSKLIKLAGGRYNPEKDTIKIGCESFETGAQNKRYLGDLVEIMIKEAQDPADTFEDVPFDFRHHKPKVVHEFPDAWKLTPERKAEILARRVAFTKRTSPEEAPLLLDGKLFIPGGKEQRTAEALRVKQVQREAILEDPTRKLREEDRELLKLEKKERVLLEKRAIMVDLKARKSTKRDKDTSQILSMYRRAAIAGAPTVPAR